MRPRTGALLLIALALGSLPLPRSFRKSGGALVGTTSTSSTTPPPRGETADASLQLLYSLLAEHAGGGGRGSVDEGKEGLHRGPVLPGTDPASDDVELDVTNLLFSRNWHNVATPCGAVPDSYYTLENVSSWCAATYTSSCRTPPERMREWFPKCEPPAGVDGRGRNLVVWIRKGRDVTSFAQHVLPLMEHPFELITTETDFSVPKQIQGAGLLLESPKLIAWYTQNYDGTTNSTKLHPVPIGLNMHAPKSRRKGQWSDDPAVNLDEMERIRRRAFEMRGRRAREFYLPPMGNNHPERKRAHAVLAGCGLLNGSDYAPRIPLDEMYEAFARYRFGISPRGNGLDCHRTWEMLFFGMIPIVKTGPLDPLYENLPVLIVGEWDDICPDRGGQRLMDEFYAKWEYQVPVDDEKLTMGFYLERARKRHRDMNANTEKTTGT